MKAVILAAGASKRLLPLTADKPKCLLGLGNESVLKRMLKQLHSKGINEIILLVGFKKEKIQEEVSKLNMGLVIKTISNDDYDKTNNIYSLWLAKKELEGNDFIQIDGDLICESPIIERLVKWKAENGLVIDNNKYLGEEEMKVLIKDSKIKSISKKIKPEHSHGEYIGLAKFSKSGSKKLFEELKVLIDQGQTDVFYEAGFDRVAKKIELKAQTTGSSKWTEIDTVEDYEEAKKMIKQK